MNRQMQGWITLINPIDKFPNFSIMECQKFYQKSGTSQDICKQGFGHKKTRTNPGFSILMPIKFITF